MPPAFRPQKDVDPEPDDQLIVYDAEEAVRVAEQTARDQAELNLMKAVLGSVFSVRKPRDAIAGTSSGLKTVFKGVGLGLASLVAQPYLGAKHDGAKGFVKGIGAGVATCAASTVTGTVIGTGQIVRGVVNTPNAVVQKARGQVWSSENRKWERDWYSLPEEAAEVFSGNGTKETDEVEDTGATGSSSSSRRPKRKVADTTLYEVLGVPPEANEAEIRRAFYKKSLALHPDKNPNNAEATQQFQAVSDAYRVLSDEDRRRLYDDHGKETAAAGMQKIEPAVFFAALFGSHHFEPFVGRLRLAQEVDSDLQALLKDAVAGNEDEPPAIDILKLQRTHDKMKVVQREREVQCALDLVKRLDPVVGLTPEESSKAMSEWEAQHATDVAKLETVPCGVEMLYLIGWVYANRAQQFFAGSMVQRVLARVSGKVHLTHSKEKLAGSVGSTCTTVNGVMKKAEKKKKKEKHDEEPSAAETKDEHRNKDEPPPTSSSGAEDSQSSRRMPDNENTSPVSEDSGTTAETPAASPPRADAANSEAAADSRSGTTDERQHILEGSLVMIHGLQNAELNNEVGMVVGFDEESDRYRVQVLPDIGLKSLKAANILVLETPSGGDPEVSNAASGASTSGGASSSSAPPPSGNEGQQKYGSDNGQWAPGGDEAEMAEAFKDCMPFVHDALWNATALDIEFTLDHVIQKILRDMSVSKVIRRDRAQALLRLGRLLQAPMAQRRKQKKSGVTSEFSTSSGNASTALLDGGTAGKKSMLARFKARTPWRPSAERKSQKAKAADAKQKRMEAALVMMAAGASTEDVDEMMAVRAAMEAEMEAEGAA